jgi:hypothetical protein
MRAERISRPTFFVDPFSGHQIRAAAGEEPIRDLANSQLLLSDVVGELGELGLELYEGSEPALCGDR